jgi:hypothetical protein
MLGALYKHPDDDLKKAAFLPYNVYSLYPTESILMWGSLNFESNED